MDCNEDGHDWCYTEDGEFHIAGLGETVEREVKCARCNAKGREVWSYSTTIGD